MQFVDKEIQDLIFGEFKIQRKELSPNDVIRIGNFCLKNPDFNRTRPYYILMEILRLRRQAFIYEQFTAQPMYFKNIAISERTKSQQLTQCLSSVPFLFVIQQFTAQDDKGESFQKKVIFPNFDAIILLLSQYPKSGEKLAEIW